MAKKTDPSQLMSQKLLQGWTMLAESCQHPSSPCAVPLMENRKGDKKIICFGCMSEFSRDEGGFMRLVAGPVPVTPAPVPAPKQSELKVDAPKTSAVAAARELLQDLDDCEDPDYDEYADWKPPTAEEQRSIEEHMKESQKHSAAIGEKLLQGWTMTADSCSSAGCYLPLMSRKEEVVCVKCGPVAPAGSPAPTPAPTRSPAPIPLVSAAPVRSPMPAVAGSAAPTTAMPSSPPRSSCAAPATAAASLSRDSTATTTAITPLVSRAVQRPPMSLTSFAEPATAPAGALLRVQPSAPEADAVVSAVQAVKRQVDAVTLLLSQPRPVWWPQHAALFAVLEEARVSLVELTLHANQLHLPLPTLQLVRDACDLSAAAAVVAAEESEAAAALKNCHNWVETAELVRLIGCCARWLRGVGGALTQ